MQIGIIGKTNTGKTTLFSAATLVDAEISNRIFTTIEPNKGVGYVTAPCPCRQLGVKCQPQNSRCVNGTRLIPVRLIDIAGLVPGAHLGRGLGNQFLSDIMEANALVHVVDASGGTDSGGNPCPPGTHDPMEDVLFLEEEIDFWMLGILKKNYDTLKRKAEAAHQKLDDVIYKQLSGLGITHEDVKAAMRHVDISGNPSNDDMLRFVSILRKKAKPMIIAANKVDMPEAEKGLARLKETEVESVPCSAECELALRKAEREGDIEYVPGAKEFKLIKPDLEPRKMKALEIISERVLKRFGSTGVQQCLNQAVFRLLGMRVVYPVEDETHFRSGKGHVLPDAYLVPAGTTPRQLAGMIHTDFAEKFVAAVNARTRLRVAADYELKDGDIIKIMLRR
ncbi:MAG: redox-regulated ATPase YchF [Candidatus Aenigmarchaeota archaeon]|nr:redox-regulated ATPase YchF [Candidatus Aenigmarchaeota archaeon]